MTEKKIRAVYKSVRPVISTVFFQRPILQSDITKQPPSKFMSN